MLLLLSVKLSRLFDKNLLPLPMVIHLIKA